MGVLEWIGAHLLAPAVNLWRALNARPRPDLRINRLEPTGGEDGSVRFRVVVQNYGNQPADCEIRAHVGETPVECTPERVNLVGNRPEVALRVRVPRPQLGDLVKELNGETTLYDRRLTIEISAGKHHTSASWDEVEYDPETDRARWQVQQRVWRLGRGEETPEDIRAQDHSTLVERYNENFERETPRSRGDYF